jgi:hypothetical protein
MAGDTDFFGYSRDIGSLKKIASSESLSMTGGGIGSQLIQSIQMQYGQNIRTLFAVGNSNVYFVGGQAQGTLDFERMSACGDMFKGIQGGNCGKIGTITLAGKGETSCFCAPGGATLTDGLLENISLKATAGQIEIIEGGRIRFASFKKG